MNTDTQRAVLGIALLAAFVDGEKDDREREQIRRLAERLAGDAPALDLPQLMQDVLLHRYRLDEAAAALQTPAHRQLAYEMALCVCDADGSKSAAEQAFLADLKTSLGLGARVAATAERQADALAELVGPPPEAASSAPAPGAAASPRLPVPVALPDPGPAAGQGSPEGAPPALTPTVPEAQIDKSILNYAILNGALELLPQSWASMAIIPLQMKMVYGIGKAHGVELDRGHVREFLAAAGIGLSSQYLEQVGRKLIGGMLGKVLGRGVGGLGRAATGVAFSFATTYALGQLAKRYYAGGRQMNTALLQQTFEGLLGQAKGLQQQYLPQIRQKAGTLNANEVMKLVRP